MANVVKPLPTRILAADAADKRRKVLRAPGGRRESCIDFLSARAHLSPMGATLRRRRRHRVLLRNLPQAHAIHLHIEIYFTRYSLIEIFFYFAHNSK